jgi:hypothetical protein
MRILIKLYQDGVYLPFICIYRVLFQGINVLCFKGINSWINIERAQLLLPL